MNQSELINELAGALSKAQGEMQAAIKDKVNPFFKSSYADLGSVWDAARPVLSKHGLCVLQTTELVAEGKIVMVTTLAHTSGQWVKSFLPLNPAKNDSQGVGSALTYLRRYSLSAIVGVVCDEDDDGETAVGRGKSHPENPTRQNRSSVTHSINESTDEKVGKVEIIALTNLIRELDEESNKSFFSWIGKNVNAQKLEDLPLVCFVECIRSLNNKIKYINDKNKQQQSAVA